ncbi:MAG: glycosyltransferase [Porphyromonadaceae bacterium]|nr:glycosyltransferase [Porphyromonadaceae bacterium]
MLKANSGWSHKLYDDEDIKAFILKYYGRQIWDYYERIDPFYGAARADFFRYLLIYQLGGVYLDIKTTVKGDLNTLLKEGDEFLLSFWDNEPGDLHEGQTFVPELNHISRGEYVQWCIISRPRHPLMLAVIVRVLQRIDSYNPYKDGMGFMGTIRTTGPAPYTLAIEEAINKGARGYRWVSFAKDLAIQYSIYEQEGKSLAHKNALKSNYHLGKRPVVRHKNQLIQFATVLYMKLLGWYRKRWIKK